MRKAAFSFQKKTGSCAHMLLARDWDAYGPVAFSMDVLETLEKNPDQTPKEFRDELDMLAQMYREKRDASLSY